MNRPATYAVKSFGCQMNVYDGERMAELLEADGLSLAADPAAADLVVLNTCHIREKATEKVYSEIGRLKRDDGSRPMVAVAGCVAQAEGEEIARRRWSWFGLGELHATAQIGDRDADVLVKIEWGGINGTCTVVVEGHEVAMTLVK